MTKTLLEKAKTTNTKRRSSGEFKINDQHRELVHAWIEGEIGINQVGAALGHKKGQSTMTYSFIARALRAMLLEVK